MDHPVGDRLEQAVRGGDDRVKKEPVEKLSLVEQRLARRGDAQGAVGLVTGQRADAVGRADHPVAGHEKAGVTATGEGEILQDVCAEPLRQVFVIPLRGQGVRLVGEQQRGVARSDARVKALAAGIGEERPWVGDCRVAAGLHLRQLADDHLHRGAPPLVHVHLGGVFSQRHLRLVEQRVQRVNDKRHHRHGHHQLQKGERPAVAGPRAGVVLSADH